MILVAILLASIIESLVSFAAGVAVILNETRVRRFVHAIIGFAVGVLLGVVFLDLLPETIEMLGEKRALPLVLIGFLLFFALESFFSWFHHHDDAKHTQVAAYLVLIGDAVHNFIDGVIIALAFLTDIRLGISTSLAVVLHEIPQEVSDFTILLHGGFSKWRAMAANVLVSLTTLVGALVGYIIADEGVIGILLALVAGNFLYLASADLIPELHHAHRSSSSLMQILLILFGVLLIYGIGVVVPE